MKKIWGVLLVTAFLFTGTTALAVPSLQLDISDGYYDSYTETIVTNESTFTLYALLRADEWVNTLGDTYYISAAILPAVSEPGVDLGSFSINGDTVNVTSDMYFGTPPLEDSLLYEAGDLPTHGVFPTYFQEFAFQFDPNSKTQSYDTAYDINTDPTLDPTGELYFAAFNIDASLLDIGYALHFDLYNTKIFDDGNAVLQRKAPFSHDAGYNPVPEPSSILLLGSGLIGLGILSRRKTKRA